MIDIEHAMNVSRIAKKIGRQMKLDDRTCLLLSVSGLFHDVGKIGIPPQLLSKPGTLSLDEHKIIEWHTTMGHLILSQMPDDIHKAAAEVALYHHERIDGNGGYIGLRGEQIPLAARIVAVADVYDALSSDRPYRKAWAPLDVQSYLCENAGKMFDYEVVGALFLALKGE